MQGIFNIQLLLYLRVRSIKKLWPRSAPALQFTGVFFQSESHKPFLDFSNWQLIERLTRYRFHVIQATFYEKSLFFLSYQFQNKQTSFKKFKIQNFFYMFLFRCMRLSEFSVISKAERKNSYTHTEKYVSMSCSIGQNKMPKIKFEAERVTRGYAWCYIAPFWTNASL